MKKRTFLTGLAAGTIAALCPIKAENIPSAPKAQKILIAYYSWGGNTKFAAETIQKALGGDIYEIKPKVEYPRDYQACTEKAEQDIDQNIKPELATKIPDLSKYDLIFVGSPNWWSTIAPPVATFLSSKGLENKTIIPFITHGGGGMSNCESDMKKLCPKSQFKQGKAFSGRTIKDAQKSIEDWAKTGITPTN